MNNILSLKKAQTKLSKLNKKKVLVGGCFDIIHIGHTTFLEKSKKKGDLLIVLLESDQNIKKLKGNGRPINDQKLRARVLASLKSVDYVVLLPALDTDAKYDEVVTSLHPDIIAATKGDPHIFHKKRQAKLIGAKVLEVTGKIKEHSTTKLLDRQIMSDSLK